MHTYIHTYIHIIYTHTHTHAHTYTYTYTYTCIFIYGELALSLSEIATATTGKDTGQATCGSPNACRQGFEQVGAGGGGGLVWAQQRVELPQALETLNPKLLNP